MVGCLGAAGVLVPRTAADVHADPVPALVDIWTFGSNGSGQLAQTFPNPSVPSPIHEAGDWVAVAAGSGHALALTASGEVWAWGRNSSGQLGNGTTAASMLPVRVPDLDGITLIAAGGSHSLAYRASDGALFGWGANSAGQLGAPSSLPSSPTPIRIAVPGALRAISAGATNSAAITVDGTLYVWGANQMGQLGQGDFVQRETPTLVPLPRAAVSVGTGSAHTIVALDDGTVTSFGWNVFGQLGRGFTSPATVGEPTPAAVVGVTDVVEVAAGDLHSLGRTADGHVWVWGYNTEGQLGNGPPNPASDHVNTPQRLTSIDHVSVVRAGGIHSIVLRDDGEVWTWGHGALGACGTNARRDVRVPTPALLAFPARAIAGGGQFSVVLATPAPTSALTGLGAAGAALELPKTHPATRDLPSLTDVIQLASGFHHTLALDGEHRVLAWGDNTSGQLGDAGPGRDDPALVDLPLDGAAGFVGVAARANQSFALRSDGAVFAWGDGTWGQLGTGVTGTLNAPARVPLPVGAVTVAAGERHTLILGQDGILRASGQNLHGELGVPPTDALTLTPAVVPQIVGPVGIAAGGFHNLALTPTGMLLAWGAGARGQLGTPSRLDSATPLVAVEADVTAIAGGRLSTLYVQAGGAISGFGDNTECQLGQTPLVDSFDPVRITGAGYGVAVFAGDYDGFALDYAGGLRGWGNDSGGQLGRSDDALSHSDCDPSYLPETRVTAVGAGLAHSAIGWGAPPLPADPEVPVP